MASVPSLADLAVVENLLVQENAAQVDTLTKMAFVSFGFTLDHLLVISFSSQKGQTYRRANVNPVGL